MDLSDTNTVGILYENTHGLIHNLSDLVGGLVEKSSTIKMIDLLTCNLNRDDEIAEIKELEATHGVTIRYSVDLTGHSDSMGNWLLESHGVEVKDMYFNEKIDEWKHVLHTVYFNEDNFLAVVATATDMNNTTFTPLAGGQRQGGGNWSNHDITSVTFKPGITTIGKYAFYWCKYLTSVNIPDTVRYIRANAFTSCTNLKMVVIPGSVLSRHSTAFSYTAGLDRRTIYINNSLFHYGDGSRITRLWSNNTPGWSVDLSDFDFNNADLSGVNLSGLNLSSADLSDADLSGAIMKSLVVTSFPPKLPNGFTFLASSKMIIGPGTNLSGVDMSGVNMSGVNMSGSVTGPLAPGSATPSNLPTGFVFAVGTNEKWLVGPGAVLTGADLSGADLSGAYLSGAVLTNAVTGPLVAAPTNLPTNYKVAVGTNEKWLVGPGAVLTGADLSGADLSGAYLSGAVLTNAVTGPLVAAPTNLPTNYKVAAGTTETWLVGPNVNLTDANLTDANLTDANLTDANLTDANLTGAITGPLVGTTPSHLPNGYAFAVGANEKWLVAPGANLNGADLSGADLSGAVLTGTKTGPLIDEPATLPTNYITIQDSDNDNDNDPKFWIIGPGVDVSGANFETVTFTASQRSNITNVIANDTQWNPEYAIIAGLFISTTDLPNGVQFGAATQDNQIVLGYKGMDQITTITSDNNTQYDNIVYMNCLVVNGVKSTISSKVTFLNCSDQNESLRELYFVRDDTDTDYAGKVVIGSATLVSIASNTDIDGTVFVGCKFTQGSKTNLAGSKVALLGCSFE